MQIFAAKPQLDDDFSEDDFLSSACSSRRESFCSLDTLDSSTSQGCGSGGGSGGRMHRRRSSTSDAAKFREKLHSLSKSVERQENLVAESPREGQEEELEEEERGETEGGAERVNGHDFTDYHPSELEHTDTNSNTNNDNGSLQSAAAAKEDTAAEKPPSPDSAKEQRKMLNFSEKAHDSTCSDITSSSVYSVGFDL